MIFKIGFVLCITFTKLWLINGKCPQSKILYPCKCTYVDIYCGGTDEYDIKRRFIAVSNSLPKNETHFNELTINNTAITGLEANEFSSITFKKLFITNATNLEKINRFAFNGTSDTIEDFILSEAKNLSQSKEDMNSLFEALRTLRNVKCLMLYNTNLIVIPDYAFSTMGSNFVYLLILTENQNISIKSIGNYAFYNLNNMYNNSLYISLIYNLIDYLPKNAFDSKVPTNKTLYVYLESNRLNSSSFESGVFTNSKRPIELYLGNNSITILDKTIFEPIINLDNRTKIYVDLNPINITDCRMSWLLKNNSKYVNQVIGLNSTFWKQNMSYCDVKTAPMASKLISTTAAKPLKIYENFSVINNENTIKPNIASALNNSFGINPINWWNVFNRTGYGSSDQPIYVLNIFNFPNSGFQLNMSPLFNQKEGINSANIKPT